MSNNNQIHQVQKVINNTTEIGDYYHEKWSKSQELEDAKTSISAYKTALVGHKVKIQLKKVKD